MIARDVVRQRQLLPKYELSFVTRDTKCSLQDAQQGYMREVLRSSQVSLLLIDFFSAYFFLLTTLTHRKIFFDILAGDLFYERSLARDMGHQPSSFQITKSFAQRRPADAEIFLQLGFNQLFAGFQGSVQNHL